MMIALVVMGAVALFVTLVAILVILASTVIQQRDISQILVHVKLNTDHLTTIERLSVGLHSFIAGEIAHGHGGHGPPASPPDLPPGTRRMYRTEDGKYESESFDGLMRKIADDNNYSAEDLEQMRRAFEEGENDETPGDEWKNDEPETE